MEKRARAARAALQHRQIVSGFSKPQVIPSLDGLRAVSISLVLLGHLLGTKHFLPVDALHGVMEPGRLGVRVFFVISGFLITTLLLREQTRSGRISLRDFYIRRAVRILPALYVFLTFIAIANRRGLIDLPPNNLVYALTYTLNFVRQGTWWTGHLWSLCVEEQFYLLWPLIVARCTKQAAIFVAIGAFAIPPILRSMLAGGLLPGLSGYENSFPLVCDDLAIGCLLALCKPLDAPAIPYTLGRRRTVYLTVLVTLVIASLEYKTRLIPPFLFQLLGPTAISLCIAFVVWRFTRIYDDPEGRFLNSRVMCSIGVLSYSIYLWQQPFLNRYTDSVLQRFPVNLLCAWVLATSSYFLLERPLLAVRKRFRHDFSARAVARTVKTDRNVNLS